MRTGQVRWYIERTSFELAKIYWRTLEEQVKKINNLRAKKILSIEQATPEFTTADWQCSEVYYEYYI